MADVVNDEEVATRGAAEQPTSDSPAPTATEPFEPPKYIAALIAAINDSAKAAQTGALAFSAIGLYLVATAFSTTDEDLLLQHTTTISQLGVQIPVVFSFAIAPLVFVALHIFTLNRYDMLPSNLSQLRIELDSTVTDSTDQERCRQLLANVEFIVTRIAPRGSRLQAWPFRWVAVSVIALFPVAVLIVVQIGSLRYQSYEMNWAQRVALGLDLMMLLWFYRRQKLAKERYGKVRTNRPKLWFSLLWVPAIVYAADLWFLSIPRPEEITVREDPSRPGAPHGIAALLHALSQPVDLVLCPQLSWGCRFLTGDHRTLVDHVWKGEAVADLRAGTGNTGASIAAIEGVFLRNRVLRFAKLDDSRLYSADLIGADLRHATLESANLQNARLAGAHLQGANLNSAQLRGANLNEAHLQGTELRTAGLQGADLSRAQLQGADLYGARLQGASLFTAELQGANLATAQLQDAILVAAQLQGAYLYGAHLEAANLNMAELQGANLNEARLESASLSGVLAWRADARKAFTQGASIAAVVTDPKARCGSHHVCDWGNTLDRLKQDFSFSIPKGPAKNEALQRIQILDPAKPLRGEQEMAQHWVALQSASLPLDLYEKEWAEQWRRIGCSADGAPYVVTNLAPALQLEWHPFHRAVSQNSARLSELAAAFLKEDCAGAHGMSEETRAQLMALRDRTP